MGGGYGHVDVWGSCCDRGDEDMVVGGQQQGGRRGGQQRVATVAGKGNGAAEEKTTKMDGLQAVESHDEEEKGGSKRGLPQGRRAVGGAVDVAGQRLAATTGRWPRAGEGGGSGVSVRSAQRWLRLRAMEAAIEATLEEKGRWWSVVGAGEEEGVRLCHWERALDSASGWRAARVAADVAAGGEEWLATTIEEESKAVVKVGWKRLDSDRGRRGRQQREGRGGSGCVVVMRAVSGGCAWSRKDSDGRREEATKEKAAMVDGLQAVEGWRWQQWQRVLRLAVAFGRATGKKKGAEGSSEGRHRGGGLLAAVGGTINAAGQRLAVATGRWPRVGEGRGSGVSVRSTHRWLRLRAREEAANAAQEEKGRWWPTAGAGEEEGMQLVLSWRKRVEKGINDIFEGIRPSRSFRGDLPPKSMEKSRFLLFWMTLCIWIRTTLY
ncbi:hypothetical protein B296_00027886 [Ensete ventricosum]|uniref:Uncharacterized protein n=1 Tax=Ensete ventricosum TaxID=4639 RepID=A0A426XUN8_ENSVE|nr:hypothetical protein B296_00027886 [Ensete ventricosum]